jgi:hypothetical protein
MNVGVGESRREAGAVEINDFPGFAKAPQRGYPPPRNGDFRGEDLRREGRNDAAIDEEQVSRFLAAGDSDSSS